MHWYGDGMGGWGFLLMAIGMILFWGVIIAGLLALVRYLGRANSRPVGPSAAEHVLAERFARGEIDEAEFQQRLRVLRGGPGTPPA